MSLIKSLCSMKLRAIDTVSAFLAAIILFIVSCESEENIEFKQVLLIRRFGISQELIAKIVMALMCRGLSAAFIPPLTDSVYLKNN